MHLKFSPHFFLLFSLITITLFQNTFACSDTTRVSNHLENQESEAAASYGHKETLESIDERKETVEKYQSDVVTKKFDLYDKKTEAKSQAGYKQVKNLKESKKTHKGSKYRKNHLKKQSKSVSVNKAKRQKRQSTFWRSLGKFLELDWIMVLIAVVLPAALIALIYFLAGGAALSFIEMFLFALGFGAAVFSFIFFITESNFEMGVYDFFIRYGFISWPGLLAIIAGFAGLFGATGGGFLVYLLIGLILGAGSFLLSLFLKKSMFNVN